MARAFDPLAGDLSRCATCAPAPDQSDPVRRSPSSISVAVVAILRPCAAVVRQKALPCRQSLPSLPLRSACAPEHFRDRPRKAERHGTASREKSRISPRSAQVIGAGEGSRVRRRRGNHPSASSLNERPWGWASNARVPMRCGLTLQCHLEHDPAHDDTIYDRHGVAGSHRVAETGLPGVTVRHVAGRSIRSPRRPTPRRLTTAERP